MKCDKCNGTTITNEFQILIDKRNNEEKIRTKFCLRCNGTGKLDWIENITGSKTTSKFDDILGHKTTQIKSLKGVWE